VQADWLANFVYDLQFGEEARNERFLRLVVRRDGVRRPMLMCSCKAKYFSSNGLVSRVRG